MKTGILITARLGSTRLSRKHLLCVNHQPILSFLIKRISIEFAREIEDGLVKVIIVTSDETENRDFEKLARENRDLSVFYGSNNNIPFRHLQAARAHDLNNMVSIDGDDIFCSVRGIRRVYEALRTGGRYVKTSQLPFGMNSFGYSVEFLEASVSSHSLDVLETGWGRIFDEKKVIRIDLPVDGQAPLLRFTLDYPEDFEFFKAVIETLKDRIYTVSDEEIVSAATTFDLFKLNEGISKTYWENYYKNIDHEAYLNESE